MVEANNTTSPKSPIHFADANEAGKIMYIQQPKDIYSACFGGLMGLRSHTIGALGVVVDGRFRDVAEIQELGLPVRIPFSFHLSISGILKCTWTTDVCSWNFNSWL
jgi:regulator of RNase E activity RraA